MTGDGAALARIAAALERMSPPPQPAPDLAAADAFVWMTGPDRLEPVAPRRPRRHRPARRGRPRPRHAARQHPAVRPRLSGQQRAALGRARHGQVEPRQGGARRGGARGARPAEADRAASRGPAVDRPAAGAAARRSDLRFLLFCDDLSFDKDDSHYKSLKAVLDGGIEGRPDNVVLYATSNRRHLMPREMIENERQTGVNPSEATEEKVSLSDRFGLWLGFHACTQDDFLAMIRGYCDAYRHRHLGRRAARRGDRMEPDPRGAVGAGGVAVCHRSGGPARGADGVRAGSAETGDPGALRTCARAHVQRIPLCCFCSAIQYPSGKGWLTDGFRRKPVRPGLTRSGERRLQTMQHHVDHPTRSRFGRTVSATKIDAGPETRRGVPRAPEPCEAIKADGNPADLDHRRGEVEGLR